MGGVSKRSTTSILTEHADWFVGLTKPLAHFSVAGTPDHRQVVSAVACRREAWIGLVIPTVVLSRVRSEVSVWGGVGARTVEAWRACPTGGAADGGSSCVKAV